MEKTAVVVGTGNVATHLVPALLNAGVKVLMIYGRTLSAAKELSERTAVPFTTEWSELPAWADYYIYAVSDNALAGLLYRELATQALHLHTAGSIGMEVFPTHKPRHGVLYPLQTFSKSKSLNFKEVPLFIEGSALSESTEIFYLARTLSNKVFEAGSAQRRQLHLAAVFACNFVNHLYAISDGIVQSSGIPFEVLRPLIAETASKIAHLSPREAQTGPALRGDTSVMEKHLALLADHPSYREIYELLSASIGKQK